MYLNNEEHIFLFLRKYIRANLILIATNLTTEVGKGIDCITGNRPIYLTTQVYSYGYIVAQANKGNKQQCYKRPRAL